MSVFLGIVIGIFAKAATAIGLLLQKKALVRQEAIPEADRRPFSRNPKWLIGFAVMATGNLVTIGALTLAPQSIIAALDALVLVFNAALAPKMLGEEVTRRDWAAVAIIVAGVMLVVAFGPPFSALPNTSGDSLVRALYYWKGGFPVFAILLLLLLAALLVRDAMLARALAQAKADLASRKGDDDDDDDDDAAAAAVSSSSSSATESDGSEGSDGPDKGGASSRPAAGPLARSKQQQRLDGMASAVIPAILSAFNVQLSKIVGELIAAGSESFVSWEIYVFLVLLIVCNVAQVIRLQASLSRFPAGVVIPVFQVGVTVLSVIGGGLYFREFESFSTVPVFEPLLFAVGLAAAVAGVGLLSMREATAMRKFSRAKKKLRFVARAVGAGAGKMARPLSKMVEDAADAAAHGMHADLSHRLSLGPVGSAVRAAHKPISIPMGLTFGWFHVRKISRHMHRAVHRTKEAMGEAAGAVSDMADDVGERIDSVKDAASTIIDRLAAAGGDEDLGVADDAVDAAEGAVAVAAAIPDEEVAADDEEEDAAPQPPADKSSSRRSTEDSDGAAETTTATEQERSTNDGPGASGSGDDEQKKDGEGA